MTLTSFSRSQEDLHYIVPMISHEPVDGILPNLPGYIIGASLRADYVLVTLTLLSRSQED